MGDGRFGPVFLADDPASNRRVVIRTFVRVATVEQGLALAGALAELCQIPLEHPAIARPLTAGVEGDTVYLAQSYLPGVSAAELLAESGPMPLADAAPPLTQIAAALDFAAAAGVYHGDLTLRDIIIGPEGAGVSGLGCYRALQRAGIEGIDHLIAARERDLRALVALTSELLTPADRARVDAVRGELPESALAFVAALPQAAPEPAPADVPEQEIALPDPEITPGPSLLGSFSGPAAFDELPAPVPVAPIAGIDQRRSSVVPLAIAASLAVGLVAGFAGGYVVAQRPASPAPVAAVSPAPAAAPAATSGRAYTDEGIGNQESGGRAGRGSGPEGQRAEAEPVQEPTVKPEPVAPERPAPAAPRVAPVERPERSERAERPRGPAALFVDSHPSGAQVFVDGRVVGRTPMLVSDVRPGSHAVRLEMATYRSWRTTVDVSPGTRTRVAASLEQ